jgi:hypothetical protein
VEGKQRKRKSQESDILPGTPDKIFIENKEKEKASKMKGRAERQLKGLKAVQKENQKAKKKKNSARRKLSLSMPSTSTHSSTVCLARGQTFEDDWVQCGSCLEWWHEDCSRWEEGGKLPV